MASSGMNVTLLDGRKATTVVAADRHLASRHERHRRPAIEAGIGFGAISKVNHDAGWCLCLMDACDHTFVPRSDPKARVRKGIRPSVPNPGADSVRVLHDRLHLSLLDPARARHSATWRARQGSPAAIRHRGPTLRAALQFHELSVTQLSPLPRQEARDGE